MKVVVSGGSLTGQPKYQNPRLRRQIIDFCNEVAGSCQITAACIVGDYVLEVSNVATFMEILLVVRNFPRRLMSYVKVLEGTNAVIFAVDKWIFERDVDRGLFGEALAGRLVFPYISIVNEDYLHRHEVRLKKRLIFELLENLVLNFPQLSYSLHIEPRYFMYETMMNRARLFPPLVYSISKLLQKGVRQDNVKSVMRGYLKAIEELEEDSTITLSGVYVRIPEKFAERTENRKVRFTNIFKTAQRALFISILETFSKTLGFLSESRSNRLKFQRVIEENSEFIHQLEDPLKYLHIPTSRGLVALSDRTDIESFAQKVVPKGSQAEIEIEKIGGVLNDIYLIRTSTDNKEKRIIVKRFKDWSSFKWFPISIWTFGTTTFAVSGRSRLERECAINQQLLRMGFNVPKILYVSHQERLVFMEYVKGEKIDNLIKRIVNSQPSEINENDLNVVTIVGQKFAEVHALGIALGDTKPENIMVREGNGEICLLDLEQASRNGDKVWDIAEFLYYAGHYVPPLIGPYPAELITKAFLEGYVGAGGDIKLVKKAGSPKYTKVFSVFTLPHIIFVIANICRKQTK